MPRKVKSASRYATSSVPSKPKPSAEIKEVNNLPLLKEEIPEVNPQVTITTDVFYFESPLCVNSTTVKRIKASAVSYSGCTVDVKVRPLGTEVVSAIEYTHEYTRNRGLVDDVFVLSPVEFVSHATHDRIKSGFVHSGREGIVTKKEVGDKLMYGFVFEYTYTPSENENDNHFSLVLSYKEVSIFLWSQ